MLCYISIISTFSSHFVGRSSFSICYSSVEDVLKQRKFYTSISPLGEEGVVHCPAYPHTLAMFGALQGFSLKCTQLTTTAKEKESKSDSTSCNDTVCNAITGYQGSKEGCNYIFIWNHFESRLEGLKSQ